MKRSDSAAQNLATHKMNCCQSVLTAFAEELDLDPLLASKLALGFGAGMALGKTCGAVTGAYMVIGLKQDLKPENAQQVKDKAYALVKEFNPKFIEINGSITCQELLGLDISTPQGTAIAKEKGLFTTLCPKFVHDAVEILEKI